MGRGVLTRHATARQARPRSASPQTSRRGRPTYHLADIFSLIETGSVVFFVPASLAQRYPRSGIGYRLVTGLPAATLVIAWPRDARSPTVAAFVRAACTVAAAVQAGTAAQKEPDRAG